MKRVPPSPIERPSALDIPRRFRNSPFPEIYFSLLPEIWAMIIESGSLDEWMGYFTFSRFPSRFQFLKEFFQFSGCHATSSFALRMFSGRLLLFLHALLPLLPTSHSLPFFFRRFLFARLTETCRWAFNFVWDHLTSLQFRTQKNKETCVSPALRSILIQRTQPNRLHSLVIVAKELTSSDSRAISSRHNLRELTLRWKENHNWGIDEALRPLSRLSVLDVTGSGLRFHLTSFAAHSQVRKLCLHELDRVAMDLSRLKELPIETLHIEVPLAEELEQLTLFPTLRHLILRRRGNITAALDTILEKTSRLSQVHSLRLGENGGMVTLKVDSSRLLQKLNCLSTLHLSGVVFTSDSWLPITKMPRVRSLHLRKCHSVSV